MMVQFYCRAKFDKPAILQPMLQRLAEKEWADKSVKLRAKGQDGQMHVGVLSAAKKDGGA